MTTIKASSGGHHATSFTDLMASLLVIFVLLFVASVNNAAAKGKTVQDELLAELKKKLSAIGLSQDQIHRDERDKNAIVIIMPDSLLFSRGSPDVRPGGQEALRSLMPLLAGVLCEPPMRQNIQTVVVEGHTDTTWADARVSAEARRDLNLALSQSRSMEVVKVSLGALDVPARRGCFRSLLSASGRGQEEPLSNAAGDDARQRRVVFKIRVTTDVAREILEGVHRDSGEVGATTGDAP
jgi:outer membrane protein OmpA-like peptidoglycan-associated protein